MSRCSFCINVVIIRNTLRDHTLMGVELKNTNRRLSSSRKVSIAFLVLFILIGTAGFVIHYTDNSFHNIELYLAWFFVPSLIMPIVIGFQGKIYNDFLRCLFHAYLAIFSFYIINSVILYLCHSFSDSNFLSCVAISVMSPASIAILFTDKDYMFNMFLYAVPIICTLLMALLLFAFRKCNYKGIQIGGWVFTYLLFGVYYISCMYYFSNSFSIGIPMGNY
jgi:hypothetical protein